MRKTAWILLLAIACSSFTNSVKAQDSDKYYGKQIYTELGGPGVLLSANFDSRFKSGERLGFGYRIGLGFCVADFQSKESDQYGYYETRTHPYYTIPIGLNYIFGKSSSVHAFEVGGGATILTRAVSIFNYEESKKGNLIGHLSFVYRRQPFNDGFTWRIGITPMVGTAGDLFPSAAVGIGYSF